jgi:xylulokinase
MTSRREFLLFRWFRDEFGGGKSYKELETEAASTPRGSDDLLLLPHLNGVFCPSSNPDARGVFYGFSLAHTRGHFVRALFESVAFMLRENLDMLETMGIPVESVCSLGGGAQSPLWLQIKADVLNRDIVTVDTEEETCLGVAVLASVAAGFYASVDEAVRGMVRFNCTYHPSPDAVDIYQRAYENYLCLNKTLLPTFGEKND